MKKVININFQGTIVPIEESSYELLNNISKACVVILPMKKEEMRLSTTLKVASVNCSRKD